MEHKKHMEHRFRHHFANVFKVIFIAIFILVIFLLMGYVVMRLWNWLMPDLFDLGTVSYWQAVGILVLAKLIFGFDTGGKSKNSKSKKKPWTPWKKEGCNGGSVPFEHWKFYDRFWEEEGERAFGAYVERITREDGNKTKEGDTPQD